MPPHLYKNLDSLRVGPDLLVGFPYINNILQVLICHGSVVLALFIRCLCIVLANCNMVNEPKGNRGGFDV